MMGLLHYQAAARGGIFSFKYGPAWLKHAEALAFDPDLSLVEGPQYPAAERESFGILLDSSKRPVHLSIPTIDLRWLRIG